MGGQNTGGSFICTHSGGGGRIQGAALSVHIVGGQNTEYSGGGSFICTHSGGQNTGGSFICTHSGGAEYRGQLYLYT